MAKRKKNGSSHITDVILISGLCANKLNKRDRKKNKGQAKTFFLAKEIGIRLNSFFKRCESFERKQCFQPRKMKRKGKKRESSDFFFFRERS